MMTLTHYTNRPLLEILTRVQPPSGGGIFAMKPAGLWLSVDGDDDWKTWCESERYDGFGKRAYAVTLKPDANILYLSTAGEIIAFTKKYGSKHDLDGEFNWAGHWINWQRVSEEYQGVIIAPYCWLLRLEREVNWYYGWDCASGYVWDAAAIESVALKYVEIRRRRGMSESHWRKIRKQHTGRPIGFLYATPLKRRRLIVRDKWLKRSLKRMRRRKDFVNL